MNVAKTCHQDVIKLSTVFTLGPPGVGLTLDDMNIKELYAANVGVLVRMKTQVAATSAAVKYAGSVDTNVNSESNSKEET